MKKNEKINQIYENLNKKSVASSGLYENKKSHSDFCVKFERNGENPSRKTPKKDKANYFY